MEEKSRQKPKTPSLPVSLIPVAALVGMLVAVISVFGDDALSGASQTALLVAAALTAAIGIAVCKVRWADIEEAVAHNIKGVVPGILILLMIGAISGTWMISGVVPTLIYYGLGIIHPKIFLLSSCIICAVVSVLTGSSWTTIATIGVALLGIGRVQGFEPGWIAGAIISGAYFGDKISPLSDTTVLASSVAGTPIFTHIRYMMITTVPSLCIALVIFTIAGLAKDAAPTDHIAQFSDVLKGSFNISPWLLFVPVITGVMIAFKLPALVTLFASAVTAAVFALIFQPDILRQITVGGSLFEGTLTSFFGSTAIDTGYVEMNSLVSTRGMAGMLNTVWLIICAMCFGGALIGSGMLGSITNAFKRFVRRPASVVAATAGTGIFLNIATADQYLSVIMTGKLFRELYEEEGYENRLLSRTVEDSATVTSVLIPWNTCGMAQATVLGVSTWIYFPYCFFNLVSPVMSVIVAATGYKIFRKTPVSAPAPETAE